MLCTAAEDGLRFADLNPEWERTLGWSLEELRSRPFTDFIHPDDLEPTYAIIREMREGAPALNFENRYRAKDGSWVWLSWASVLRGGVFYAAVRDVTAYKEVVEALEERNAELGQFAHAASHDLQEPLRAIIGHLGYVRTEGLDEDSLRALRSVGDGAARMQELLEGLLAYARIDTQGKRFQPTAMSEPIEGAITSLNDAIQRSGARVTVQEMLPRLAVDTAQMSQVFQNLIANAVKYHKPDVAPEVTITAEPDGAGFRFCVADNGVGFEQSRAERAFVMFQRLHRRSQYDGLGVGLALVRRIVQRHGGRTWLEGAVGRGACAYVWLPRERGE